MRGTKNRSSVNTDVGAANEQIRISDRVKRELERRKRANESYNDVLERILEDTETDFDDGFGSFRTSRPIASVRSARRPR